MHDTSPSECRVVYKHLWERCEPKKILKNRFISTISYAHPQTNICINFLSPPPLRDILFTHFNLNILTGTGTYNLVGFFCTHLGTALGFQFVFHIYFCFLKKNCDPKSSEASVALMPIAIHVMHDPVPATWAPG